MFGNASQGGEQADQLYLGMLGSLIAFLWSVAEYLPQLWANVSLRSDNLLSSKMCPPVKRPETPYNAVV